MRFPDYLYHYTSVQSLALILSSRKVRFSPLTVLDDLQEAQTADISDIGRSVYISSWTSDSKESIPMWNMYSCMDSGIRIKALALPFVEWDQETNQFSGYKMWAKDIHRFPQDLEEVIYSDDRARLYPQIKVYGTGRLCQKDLGKYKSTAWEFQKEWRHIIRMWPGPSFDELLNQDVQIAYKKFATLLNPYMYLRITDEAFEKLEITLSPKITEGNRVIVEALKEKYCPSLEIRESELYNLIR